MPENKAYRLRPARCILLPSAGLPICHNIRTTAEEEHNHGSPVEQTRQNALFSANPVPLYTKR